jgi:SAM-dependent methyltransferase
MAVENSAAPLLCRIRWRCIHGKLARPDRRAFKWSLLANIQTSTATKSLISRHDYADAMSLLPDYSSQAKTYDQTRAASPSVLAPLRSALAGAPGPRLADIGGGTGNYALALQQEGWEPVVVDLSPDMLQLADQKGLSTIVADAQRLPIPDESFDAAMLVSMLHHVADPAAAISEAQRILRVGGRLAAMVFTLEDVEDLWLLDYFPSSRVWMRASHTSLPALLDLLPGAVRHEIVFGDLEDACLAALASHPECIIDPRWRSQTSYFERLQRDHADELGAGLDRLAHDLASGAAPRRPGRGSILAWSKSA